MARTAMDSAKKTKIYSLYSEGISTAAIAERFGLSRRYISQIVQKMRVACGNN